MAEPLDPISQASIPEGSIAEHVKHVIERTRKVKEKAAGVAKKADAALDVTEKKLDETDSIMDELLKLVGLIGHNGGPPLG